METSNGVHEDDHATGTATPGSGTASLPSQGVMPAYMPMYVPPAPLSTNPVHAEALRQFWQQQYTEVQQCGTDPAEFKNTQLPLARIKKIMKSDEDVRMISAEAPVLFAKACEMFILELTLRAWHSSEENKRRTLQRNDISAAITKTDIFDFLVDIVPRDERPEGGEAAAPSQPPAAAVPTMAPPPGAGLYFPQPGMFPVSSEAMIRPPMPGMDPSAMMFPYHAMVPPPGWPGMPGMPPMGAMPVPEVGGDANHEEQQDGDAEGHDKEADE